MTKAMKELPSLDRLNELLAYDPDAGLFTWKVWRRWSAPVGGVAGNKVKKGYIKISIDGVDYSAHRIAWKMFYGSEPVEQVDHINGDKSDNRICNLRAASNAQNQANVAISQNNTCGFKGVSFHKHSGKWQARIGVNYKRIHIGKFNTPEEAHEAYKKAAKEYFGEYART
jgi:hypothetical protein